MQLRRLDYVPVLKWRQGEYLALSRLMDGDKDWVTPLLEVTPPEFDFETNTVKKTLDQQLAPFAKRLHASWGSRYAFLDTRFLSAKDRMADATHPLSFLLKSARALGCRVVPVTNLERDLAHDNALGDVLLQDDHGLAFRCSLDDLADTNFDKRVRSRLKMFDVEADALDLLVDLGDANLEAFDDLADLLIASLEAAPIVREARSLVILATAFPKSMGEVAKGVQTLSRNEWKLYKALIDKLPADVRRPTFGDYAISSPHLVTGDMRRLKPAATVRLTVENAWVIAKGGVARGNHAQFKTLCGDLRTKVGLRKGLSPGADYIFDCADGKASTGTQTTWRWVGTNHHVTRVLADLARLYEP